MFASITENPYKPAGKLANETTRKMISTQYSLGRPEWAPKWESHTTNSFQNVGITTTITLTFAIASEPSQVRECSEVRRESDLLRHRQGRAALQHQGSLQASTRKVGYHVIITCSYVRARPLRDKAALMATNYKVSAKYLLNC